MIILKIDDDMPKSCRECRMPDSEFMYCHGIEVHAWNVEDYMEKQIRPDWCPLIEVKNE